MKPSVLHPVMSAVYDKGFRLVKDPSWSKHEPAEDRMWCWELPCRRGRRFGAKRKAHISAHGEGTLAYSGLGMKLRRELLAIPGVRSHQTGDEEFAVTFPTGLFEAVAAVVKPYRRKVAPSFSTNGGVSEAPLNAGTANEAEVTPDA